MRRSLAWAGLGLVLLVAVGLVVAASQHDRRGGPPLDPRSTAPNGTRAMVVLAERYGVAFELRDGGATPAEGVALVLDDRLARPDREALLSWARDGGTIVVTDPSSPLTPAIAGGLRDGPAERRTCPAGFAARSVQGAEVAFEVGAGADSCFGDGRAAVVVADQVGQGRVIAVGGAGPFTNAELAAADNAGLLLELLGAGQAGPATVTILGVSPVGEGDQGLWALVPTAVRLGFVQGLVALGLFVWASARRLGQPVPEPRLRELPGSALTAALGELYHRGHQRDAAAAILHRRLRRSGGSALVTVDVIDGGPAGPPSAQAVRSDAELVELALAAGTGPPVRLGPGDGDGVTSAWERTPGLDGGRR